MRKDAELDRMLEEAEHRKEMERKRVGRLPTLLVIIPVLSFFVWAGVFLIRYNPDDTPALAKPVVATAIPGQLTDQIPDAKEVGELASFLPEGLGGAAPAKGAESKAPVVNHENISFAMELLNFGRSPEAWREKKK